MSSASTASTSSWDLTRTTCRHATSLLRTLGYLHDPSIGYVQAAQVYYNQPASFVARGAAEETYAYYSSIQMTTYALGYPIVTGCHNVHRAVALRQVGGFAPHEADDLLITTFYRAAGWRGVYVPETLALGLTPVDWTGYLRQQRRWARSVLDVKFRIYPKVAGRLPRVDRPASTRSSTLRRNSGGYRAVPCHSLPDRVAQESNNPPLENPGHTTRTWSGHRSHRLWWSFLALQLTDFYQEPASPETDREGREHSGRRALTTHAR